MQTGLAGKVVIVTAATANTGGNVAVTPFASSTPEQWRADLELNLMTMFRCTHLVVPPMLAETVDQRRSA